VDAGITFAVLTALTKRGVHFKIVGGVALNLRLPEAFDYAAIDTELRDVDGVQVAVATPRMLFRMKCDTVRMQDRADAERLQRHVRWED
jgi:hypothetical protein